MKRTAGLMALFCAVCPAMPIMAQPSLQADRNLENNSNDEIVVTGQVERPSRGDVAEQARELSGASRKYDENLARFQVPVCPGVVGLKREAAEMIVDRIRANLTRVGAPLAKEKCSPNLIVAIVEDGRSLLSNLQRSRPEMLNSITAGERAELLSGEAPVRVWSNIVTLNTDGVPVQRARDGREILPSVRGHTIRWFVKFHRDIVSALIVFDRKAVMEMALVQLADYATMRGLARMRPASGNEAMATILALFSEDGRNISELTNFDIGYLRSLYWEAPDEAAITKLLRIRRMAEKAREEALKAHSPR